jgi:hypothetical protein
VPLAQQGLDPFEVLQQGATGMVELCGAEPVQQPVGSTVCRIFRH